MIDFSNASSIFIPEGEVAKISRGTEILWELLKLPPEYQEVPYIESTGTQYIDTMYKPASEDFKVIFDFEYTTESKGSLFGSAVPGTQYSIVPYRDATTNFYVGNSPKLISRKVGLNTRCVLGVRAINNKFKISIDGKLTTVTYDGEILKTYNLYLFGSNRQGETAYQFSTIKLYDCQIYDNDVLVRDFIPCYRKSDGEVGMYDTVTEAFFTNAGTGKFVCEKPKYKRELQYLESTGTQWIDTGLRLNQDSKLEMMISHFDTNGSRKIFGSRTSASQNSFGVIYGPVSGIMSIVADFENYTNNRLAYVIDGNEFVEINISNEKLKINDLEKPVTIYGNFTTPENAYLFECSGKYSASLISAEMRLYYCKIYDNNIPVRDFIPVLDWNDVACLYDKVTDEFFYNQGTGKFLYGE